MDNGEVVHMSEYKRSERRNLRDVPKDGRINWAISVLADLQHSIEVNNAEPAQCPPDADVLNAIGIVQEHMCVCDDCAWCYAESRRRDKATSEKRKRQP